MEERLVQLLQAEGINPTRFAERIGVQRSSISHILSGRNKPSFDFIIKILDSFPSVNPDWLLRGKGLMYKNDLPLQPSLFDVIKTPEKDTLQQVINPIPPTNNESQNSLSGIIDFVNPEPRQDSGRTTESSGGRKIEKIVILYSDKTFSDFQPNS